MRVRKSKNENTNTNTKTKIRKYTTTKNEQIAVQPCTSYICTFKDLNHDYYYDTTVVVFVYIFLPLERCKLCTLKFCSSGILYNYEHQLQTCTHRHPYLPNDTHINPRHSSQPNQHHNHHHHHHKQTPQPEKFTTVIECPFGAHLTTTRSASVNNNKTTNRHNAEVSGPGKRFMRRV